MVFKSVWDGNRSKTFGDGDGLGWVSLVDAKNGPVGFIKLLCFAVMQVREVRLEVGVEEVIKGLGRGFYDLGAVFFGLWHHSFLTVLRLVQRWGLGSYGASFLITVGLLWLAQVVLHPEKMGVISRLWVFGQVGVVIGLVFLMMGMVGGFWPDKAKVMLSGSFLVVLPAGWVFLRSVWLMVRFLPGADLVFLVITGFLGLLEVVAMYLWLRLVVKSEFEVSIGLLGVMVVVVYWFKQMVCLWV